MAATRYTRSTDGSDADNGTTWALAKATIAGVAAIDTSGDTLWVSQAHAESGAGVFTFALAGTVALPTKLLCGNDGAEPPTALATTAAITTTSTANPCISITGNCYVYGIIFTYKGTFQPGTFNADETQIYDNCSFIMNGTGSGSRIDEQASTGRKFLKFKNCTFKFDAASEQCIFTGNVLIQGGSLLAGTTSPTSMFRLGLSGRGALLTIEDFDFSAGGSALVVIDAANSSSGNVVMRNCKMPASWTSASFAAAPTSPGSRYEMYNCDNGATNYKLFVRDYQGSIQAETVIVRTGGASDGTTPLSWFMTSNANASYPQRALESPQFVIWNDTTGSSKTATVEIIHDSVTALNNNEVWLELHYLGASGNPQGSLVSNAVADVITTAAAQSSSSVTWTTTGITNVNKQSLSVTFTPQMKGPLYARVMLAKASKSIYVDPLITVS